MGHTASLSQLQSPPWASVDGVLTPYNDVRIHISAEALTRALSFFEGLKAYWDTDHELLGFRALDAHYARLCRSAQLLHVPIHFSFDDYESWCFELTRALASTDKDIWLRTTMYVVEGHWGEGTRAELVITGFKQNLDPAAPMKVGVSTWRRAPDTVMPARIKSTANYQVSRLARIEGNARGCDDMILLNEYGRVAEGSASCIVIVRDGVVITPPPSEGALESITVNIFEKLCERDGVPFVRRPVDRSELYVADEAGLIGTITELTLVSEIDGYEMRLDGLLAQLQRKFVDVMRRVSTVPGLDFSLVKASELAS
jgi:branched-chain amino acid aminotransferase